MRLRLAGKLIAAMGVTLVMALSAGFWVVLTREDRQAREDFKREMDTITGYAKAVREFLAENPVTYAPEAAYHDLRRVPVVAAWLTAQKYATPKDYAFRTPSATPRSQNNMPNGFEQRALEAFARDERLSEYSEEAQIDGRRMFQYAVPMRLTEDCLVCHGHPKGELDPFGYPKEGYELGHLRGAFSIAAPMTALENRQQANRQAIAWLGLGIVLATGGAVFAAIRVVMRPMDGFLSAIKRIGQGHIDERVPIQSDDEVGELAREFNRMADQLEASYATLEERVHERTRALERSQSQLVQASKLAALGELVGGIAHEVNNPVGIIVMRLASLRPEAESLNLPEDVREDLNVILRQAEKIAQITSGLLAFSRQTPFSPKPSDLNKTVSNAVSLIENVLRNKGIVYQPALQNELPSVQMDATRIEQVLLNLFNNAMDAMPGGGALYVATELFEDADGAPRVRVRVRDTGEGISPEHMDRLFDPFFTTKEVGKGTGLGLAISYGLIREHGGDIKVESSLGDGAEFCIELPISGKVDEDRSA